MMKNGVETGKNRTGIDLSPIDKRLLLEGAVDTIPSMDGDESVIDRVRSEYLEEGETIGSMPLPVTVKGVTSAVSEAVKGSRATVFLDKLGERLAFERTGARLYTALLGKFDAFEPLPNGPKRAEIEKIQREELAHFKMIREAILSLGADPTAITPSADVAGVSSLGILQVVGDPRMNLRQSLEALLIAELVDNDAWAVLVELAREGGHDAIAEQCERALEEEDEHLVNVRAWVKSATLGSASLPLRDDI